MLNLILVDDSYMKLINAGYGRFRCCGAEIVIYSMANDKNARVLTQKT